MTTIGLLSGGEFDFANPSKPVFTIEDIAHGLAGERRYANQLDLRNSNGTRAIYSVAEHSIWVLLLVQLCWAKLHIHLRNGARGNAPARTINDVRWAHGHDSPEAVLRDFAGPGKDFIPGYRPMEAQVLEAMRPVLGIVGSEPPVVKRADTLVGQAERYYFRGSAPPPAWVLDVVRPMCWPEDIAKARFLDEFHKLR